MNTGRYNHVDYQNYVSLNLDYKQMFVCQFSKTLQIFINLIFKKK